MHSTFTGKFCWKSLRYFCGLSLWLCLGAAAPAQQLAFPGAEGFGAFALGGRSGTVYHVTNLANSGSGSFRDAVSAANRTIVFDVSGTINLLSALTISKSNLTIAGQTAPGDGITLMGNLTSVQSTRNVVVRFIHCRPGDINCTNFQDDAFHFDTANNSIADHVTASWSIDEALSTTWSTNISVQWCMISEPLNNSCHYIDGAGTLCCMTHGYASLIRYGTGGISYHHNLFAHTFSRNPRPGDNIHLDFVNNIIFDFQDHVGYNANDSTDNPGGYTNYLNLVNNFAISGPSTVSAAKRRVLFANSAGLNCQVYESGNLMDTNSADVPFTGVRLGWAAITGNPGSNANRFAFPQVNTDSPTGAYVRVLSSVGASAIRDAVDLRIVSDVLVKTGGLINSQNEVGGWPTLTSLPASTDTDQDGMPDYWEMALGLNPYDPTDRNGLTPDGYTRLEQYLNWLAAPHARVQTNGVAYVELQQYAAALVNPTYTVSGGSNGVVTLLVDGHNAQFVPTSGFSGLGSFQFISSNAFGSLTGTVTVVVTPMTVTPNLVWRGDGTNNWNVTTTANWLNGTNIVKFYAGDNVTFNDVGTNNPAINLVGTLLASSVTVTAAQNYTFGGTGSLGGMMSLLKAGPGQLTLATGNTYSGGTTVSNGTLLVNNSTGSGTGSGAVTVLSGGILGGTGTIGGPVSVNGTLAPGNSAGTLTVSNDLVLNSGALLQYQLGTNSDLTAVSGNLTLDGTLNVTDAGGFTNTTYPLFTYSGTLTTNGSPTILTIGSTPDTNKTYTIDISTAGQVNLVVGIIASFTASPLSGATPLTVSFTDTSSGSPAYWFWTFGDGGTSTSESPSYTYLTPGMWTASLIASNAGGASSPFTQTINVYDPFAWWQLHYFGSTNNNSNTAPNGDYTGTGMSNTNKFMAGFNPTNSAAFLHIISAAKSGANIVVTYLGANGDTNYAPGILSRTNALDFTTGDARGNYTNGAWQDTFQTNILSGGTGLGTVTNMTDAGGATNIPSRYYRVRVLSP